MMRASLTYTSIVSAAPRSCTCDHQSVAANLNAKVDGQGCRLPGRLYARPGASIGQSPIVAGPVLADTQFQLAP